MRASLINEQLSSDAAFVAKSWALLIVGTIGVYVFSKRHVYRSRPHLMPPSINRKARYREYFKETDAKTIEVRYGRVSQTLISQSKPA